MTDNELLDLAGKAAGIIGEYRTESLYLSTGWEKVGAIFLEDDLGYWNPLTDDGDALRLAVKLKIEIGWVGNQVAANNACEIGDYAATRRAIVRAAAEIGKAMP